MRLEVITELPKTKTGSTPLLFIPGAFQGAWCWELFLPFFAEHGYEAHALSLRGHGASDGHERTRWTRTAEYLEDVAEAAGRLSAPPVLIGQSMGGYVIQKYLETHTVPGAVLLASIPVSGIFKMLTRHALRHPWQALKFHLTLTPFALVETPELAREVGFSPNVPAETLNRHYARFQNESYWVGAEATVFNLPRPAKVNLPPMLVLGAANDALFSRKETEATARAYKTEAEIFPNMAHEMMLEPGWRDVAERILSWLREKRL